MPNIITRRSFLSAAGRASIGLGLASLMSIPPFLKRALAEGSIGINNKKLIFIFLRGGNDGVNNVIPMLDPSYAAHRQLLAIPGDPLVNYGMGGGQAPVVPLEYPYAVPLGNGFAALNPALRELVPIYNNGDLAVIHRVGYRSLSRSHFDSERYWEKGADGTAASRGMNDGIWYRTIVESGWNQTHALSGVSIQSNMPQSMRGAQPMTNLSSIGRYNTLGVYSPVGGTNTDRVKILNALDLANFQPYPAKDNRDVVHTLGVQFRDTLDVFQDPSFASNTWFDTDGTTYLFPSSVAQDQAIPGTANPVQYRVGSNGYGFIGNIRNCAQMLNNTDAIITGTEIGGFDTHTGQITQGSPHLGGHANLLRRIGAAYYALWRYFSLYGKGGSRAIPSAKVGWDDVVVVTMSEFGRTSAENESMGTDHAEASVMYVAGGAVNGGVHGCDKNPNSKLGGVLNWPFIKAGDEGAGGKVGALFSANANEGYLRRTIDYRSVLGEIIRDHLGATENQLDRIIPAYANPSECLRTPGTVSGTPILGELEII